MFSHQGNDLGGDGIGGGQLEIGDGRLGLRNGRFHCRFDYFFNLHRRGRGFQFGRESWRRGHGRFRYHHTCGSNGRYHRPITRQSAQRGTGAHLPIIRRGHTWRRAIGFDAQDALLHLGLSHVVAADVGQPALVQGQVIGAVRTAGNAPRQGHGNLRAKPGRQMEGVLHRITAAPAEIQRSQVGVYHLKVGHRRHNAVLQNFHGDHVFHTHAHRVAGEAFGVGDDDFVGRCAKGFAQGGHFGGGAATASRRVGLMRHEDGLCSHGQTIQAKPAFSGRNQIVHHHSNVVDVQPGAVEGAVAGFTAEEFYNAAHAAFAHGVFAFHHEGARAHTHDGAVAAQIEGQSRFGNAVVGGGRAHGQETGSHPFHQVISGNVICAQNDDAAATAVANPILGNGHALSRAGASRIHMRIRAARPDVLRKLAVPHRQNAEQEAPIKRIRLTLQLAAQFANTPVQFVERRPIAGVATQIFQRL